MVKCTVVKTTGHKFSYEVRRAEGFLLGLQVALRRKGGVQVSLFGWSLFIGMVPVREVTESTVGGSDALDKILAANGKQMDISVTYELDTKKSKEVPRACVQD
mgnify:CR=1 FL=1